MINKRAELEKIARLYIACKGLLRVKEAAESKEPTGSKWDTFRYNFNRSRAKTRNALNHVVPIESNEKATADAFENLGKWGGDTLRSGYGVGKGITDTIGDVLYELPGSVYETGKLWGNALGRAGYGIGEGLWAGGTALKDSLVDAINGTRQITGQVAGRVAGGADRVLGGMKSIGGGMLRGAKDVGKAAIVEPAVAYGGSWYHHPVTSLASLGAGAGAGYLTYKGLEKYLRNHGWDDNSWKTKALKWGGGIGTGLLTHLALQGIMGRMSDRARGTVPSRGRKFSEGADALADHFLASSAEAREKNNRRSDSNNPNNKDRGLSAAQRREYMKKNDTKSNSKPVNRKRK